MSKNRRPLTEADIARIPVDAHALLEFIRANGRPGSTKGTLTVVRPRRWMAETLGFTVRQFARAEQHLTERRAIKAVSLIPRNEHEAALNIYRWTLNSNVERTNQ